MDSTGSTNFVMFDRVVSRFIGTTPQQLLEASPDPAVLPPAFHDFLNKPILFKVDIVDGNVAQHWQHFAVKRLTSDNAIIQSFINNQPKPETGLAEEDLDYVAHLTDLVTASPLVPSEHIDSLMRDEYGPPSAGNTPTSKAASSSTSSHIERKSHAITCKRALDIVVDPPSLVSHDPTSASLCKKVLEDGANPVVPTRTRTDVRPSAKRILDVDVDLTIDGDAPAVGGSISASPGGSSATDDAADLKGSNSKCAKK